MSGIKTRFAPSPTGYMHIGNLRTALYSYLIAKSKGGTFMLRIEDTDQNRFVEGAMDVIYRTLSICGLNYDEGPDKDMGNGPYIQSQRKDIYIKYAKKLVELGHAYYCFCSKVLFHCLFHSLNDPGMIEILHDVPFVSSAKLMSQIPSTNRQQIPVHLPARCRPARQAS